MSDFDLDQAAAPKVAPDWSFRFREEVFTIPGDVSLEAWFALGEFAKVAMSDDGSNEGLAQVAAMADLRDATRSVFSSPEDYERFLALRPTQAHLVALLSEASRRATGGSLGEASELSGSSNGDGELSRPTSNASTGSTSIES